MAFKPLVILPSSYENYTFVDLGENQVYNGAIYNAKTFYANMPNLINWGTSFRSKNNAVVVQSGCVWASKVAWAGNLMASKWNIMPNPFSAEVGNTFVDDENIDELYLFLNGVSYPAVKVKNDGQLLKRGSWNLGNQYTRNSVFIKLNDGNFVGIINESYYDRTRLFVKVNKNLDTVHDFRINNNYAEACFHYFDGNSIIASSNGLNSYGRHILYKYDVSTGSVSVILDINGANKNGTYLPSNMIDIGNGKYLYFIIQPANTNSFYYRAITFDSAAMTATKEDWTADYGDKTEADVVYLDASERRFGGKLWVTVHTDSNNNKVYYAHLLTMARGDYNPNVKNFRLYTWQLDLTNKKFIYKYHIEFNTKILSAAPMTIDMTEVYVNENASASVLKFNPVTAEWRRQVLTLNPRDFISDILGRNWILGMDWGLYPLIKTAPTEVKFWLEKKVYKWKGKPIDTNILGEAVNYEGNFISVTGTLYLISDYLQFPDGSREKEVTLSADGVTSIPVKIVAASTQPPKVRFVVKSIGG